MTQPGPGASPALSADGLGETDSHGGGRGAGTVTVFKLNFET
jgi:hypothetical protein